MYVVSLQGMFRVPAAKNVPNLTPESYGVAHFWDYAAECYEDADKARHTMGLDQEYLAVHWRSETSECDFGACSTQLAAGVRQELQLRKWSSDPQSPRRCLLVSDIPFNTSEVLWQPFATDMGKNDQGHRKEVGMHTALATLGVTQQTDWNGCAKIDSIFHPSTHDAGLISIYDKILAAKAHHFYTCRIAKGAACSPCVRWQSNFGKEITQNRRDLHIGNTSLQWPAVTDDSADVGNADIADIGGPKVTAAVQIVTQEVTSYVLRGIGHCDISGHAFIDGATECRFAAASLKIEVADNVRVLPISDAFAPFGCIFEARSGAGQGGLLSFNSQGSRQSMDTNRVSVCRKPARDDTVGGGVGKEGERSSTVPCDGIEHINASFVPRTFRGSLSKGKRLRLAHNVGPILWSFPGSGNTWVRLLLESATGFLTGSVYNDQSLKKTILKGEGAMGPKVITTKAHPTRWTFSKLKRRFGSRFPAIFLVRDPFRMLWSEGQRRMMRDLGTRRPSLKKKSVLGTHQLKLTRDDLSKYWSKWESLAKTLAEDYVNMWATEYTSVVSGGGDYIFLDFEELTDRGTRHDALQNVVDFLGDGFNPDRVRCAFDASSSEGAHRPETAADDGFASIDDAMTPSLVCEIWETISKAEFAARELKFNWRYTPYGNGTTC